MNVKTKRKNETSKREREGNGTVKEKYTILLHSLVGVFKQINAHVQIRLNDNKLCNNNNNDNNADHNKNIHQAKREEGKES